jgi:hypothetical protein
MLWALCSAVLLTVLQAAREMESGFGLPRSARHRQVQDLLYCLFKGGVLAGILTLVWYRFHKITPLITQPGHWMLLYQGAFMLPLPSRLFIYWMKNEESSWLVIALSGFVTLLCTVCMVYAIFRIHAWGWRLLFSVLVITCVSYLLVLLLVSFEHFELLEGWVFRVLILPYFAGPLFAAVGMIFLSIKDLIRHQFRDWLHWTGVGAYLVVTGGSYLPLLFSLVY